MKRKLFLIVAMISVLACMLAFSVSAEGSESNAFGVAETLEGIPVDMEDTTSRVVLVDADGLYRTFPSSYIYFKTGYNNWSRGEAKLDFSYINTALGLEGDNAYTIDSVVRLEVPDDIYYFSGYNGKANLKEIYFSPDSKMANGIYSFEKSGLEKITLPKNLTSLRGYIFKQNYSLNEVAFYPDCMLTTLETEVFLQCTALEGIELPETVTTIGTGAFSGCSLLKSINLCEGLTTLGNNAFYACAFTSLELPTTLTTIGEQTFRGNKGLTALELPEGLMGIPYRAFFECTGLKSISIPASVTSIGNEAFRDCSSLKRVDFLNEGGDITFGNDIFKNLSNLETVTFKENCGITTLGTFLFNSTGIKALSIPKSVTTIGNGALQNCSKLGPVYIPSSVTSISQATSTFSGNKQMYFVNESFDVDAYNADNSIVTKPSIYYFPNILTSITCEMFKSCENMNSTLVMGDQLTSIENAWAFGRSGASTTVSVVFLGNVTKIGFEREWKLIDVYFCNENTTSEGVEVFYGNNKPSINNKIFAHFCKEGTYRNAAEGEAIATDTAPHIFEKAAVTDATCTEPSMSADFCFCGTAITEPVTVGDALGHNHDASVEANVSYVYTSLIANGTKYVKCVRCDDKTDSSVPAPFGTQGMSITTDGYAQGYGVNSDALANYILVNGISSYEFGVIAGSYRQIGGNAPINADGTTYNDKTHKFNYKDTDYTMFDIKIKGITEGYADEGVILCAYVILDGTVYYISNNVASTEPAYYSYNDVNDIVNATVPETVDYMYNEEDIA